MLKKFPEKTLIYIFYNYENKKIVYEAVKLLYIKEWTYNFEECLWFHKLNFADSQEPPQFFHLKKWELVPYMYPLKKESFAKLDDFEIKGMEESINSG